MNIRFKISFTCEETRKNVWGSDCGGSVGRAVAANTRDLLFKSSHWQTFIEHLLTVNCVEKTKIKQKEAGNGQFKKNNDILTAIWSICLCQVV